MSKGKKCPKEKQVKCDGVGGDKATLYKATKKSPASLAIGI